jgi:hypothetical protein
MCCDDEVRNFWILITLLALSAGAIFCTMYVFHHTWGCDESGHALTYTPLPEGCLRTSDMLLQVINIFQFSIPGFVFDILLFLQNFLISSVKTVIVYGTFLLIIAFFICGVMILWVAVRGCLCWVIEPMTMYDDPLAIHKEKKKVDDVKGVESV